MKTPTEIADLLIEDQESHEAIVRALHYDKETFIEWSRTNIEYISYSLASVGIPLPIYYPNNDDTPSLTSRNVTLLLWGEIDDNREEILKQFNERFNVSPNN